MTDERWDAIWDGAEESLRRLLARDDVSDGDDLAPTLELVPPVDDEDVFRHGVSELPVEPEGDGRE